MTHPFSQLTHPIMENKGSWDECHNNNDVFRDDLFFLMLIMIW